MAQHIDTVIIGGGQSGISMSYRLEQHGIEHVVLERSQQVGNSWANERWDSFALVLPNWTIRMPGAHYAEIGDDPDGFLPRDEVVKYLEDYVINNDLPVKLGVSVDTVTPLADGGYAVKTNDGDYTANNVVVAIGAFHYPRIPAFADNISQAVVQIHSSRYKSPDKLPEGAVLVVGAAQSGAQIAEELYTVGGRKVYLAVGRIGQIQRSYRGKDIIYWLEQTGFFDRTVDVLGSPQERFAGNVRLSGNGGGRTLDMHRFARDGVQLLGRIGGADGSVLHIQPNLHDNLAFADQVAKKVLAAADKIIEKRGLDVSAPDPEPELRDGYEVEQISELDLTEHNITSIVWASGYRFDYKRLVKADVFEEDTGYPLHERGVTPLPGLYFMGLQYLHKFKSATLLGLDEDATYLGDYIAARARE